MSGARGQPRSRRTGASRSERFARGIAMPVPSRYAVSRLRQDRLQAVGSGLRGDAPAGAHRRRRPAGVQAHRLCGRHGHAPPRHRRRRELRRHRVGVPRGHLRDMARRGAQGRLSGARQDRHQDAGVERQEAGRLRPHPGHPARAPAGGAHRLLSAALPGCLALEERRRTGPARRRGARARRRPHRPPRLQLPRDLRLVRGDPRRHRPLGVLPDPVQLHGRGVSGRPPRPRARGRQGSRRHRHGAGTRRRPGAQRAASGPGALGRGAGPPLAGGMGAAVGLERT